VCPWPAQRQAKACARGRGRGLARPDQTNRHGTATGPRIHLVRHSVLTASRQVGQDRTHTEGRLRCHDLAIETAPACRCRPVKRKKRPAGRPCPSTSVEKLDAILVHFFLSFLFLGFKEASDRMGMAICCTFIKKRSWGKKESDIKITPKKQEPELRGLLTTAAAAALPTVEAVERSYRN
jgi:hypothetical protein